MKVKLRNPTREVVVDGPTSVRTLLQRLDINPETVLVIRDADLLTREERLADTDEIEIRPVISGGAGRRPPGVAAKCKRCREPAKVEVARANAAFCSNCFQRYIRNQVSKAIDEHEMFSKDDRLLVCVSGGKDSLALWDMLLDMGYDATGYHIVLWTGEEYAQTSREMCEKYAAGRGATLVVTDLKADEGFTIEQIAKEGRRVPCAGCGLTKRYLTNLAASRDGYDVLVTGHNLDDEAATLLGNALHWQTEYIARQTPALPSTHEKLVKKVKPLYRVSERETAAYAILRGIDYIVEECPLVAGNTALRYKDALNLLEQRSPGTKQQFFFGYLDKIAPMFESHDQVELRSCSECGQPTTGEVCAYCRARAQLRAKVARKGRS
ncbi:MAG TPA: TIGR00269 family protein [Actinomycetota bacterium]|nr:TIGR00269 family protein [Actinomycetota bacterium]